MGRGFCIESCTLGGLWPRYQIIRVISAANSPIPAARSLLGTVGNKLGIKPPWRGRFSSGNWGLRGGVRLMVGSVVRGGVLWSLFVCHRLRNVSWGPGTHEQSLHRAKGPAPAVCLNWSLQKTSFESGCVRIRCKVRFLPPSL